MYINPDTSGSQAPTRLHSNLRRFRGIRAGSNVHIDARRSAADAFAGRKADLDRPQNGRVRLHAHDALVSRSVFERVRAAHEATKGYGHGPICKPGAA